MPSTPAPTPADPLRRDRAAASAAVCLHILVLLGLALLPEPPPPPAPLDLRVIELLPSDALPPPPPPSAEVPPELPVEPPPDPDAAEPDTEPEEPLPEEEPPPEKDPVLPPPDAPATPPPPRAPDEPEPGGEIEETADAPAAGLMLKGLRESSAPGSPLAPRLAWKPASSSTGRPSGRGASHGADTPVIFPEPVIEGKPESLEEAGFVERRNGRVVYRDPQRRFNATLHPDGHVTFRNRIGTPFAAMPGMAEALREASGQELYRNEKQRLLEATEELRMAYAARTTERHVTRELGALDRQLEEIWKRGTLTAAQRRALLFERWDECEDSQPPPRAETDEQTTVDSTRRDAGGVARRKIEAFIRRTIPRGSAEAYTEAELRAFNAKRQSKESFEPYRRG